jgi:ERCC4-type nuclease
VASPGALTKPTDVLLPLAAGSARRLDNENASIAGQAPAFVHGVVDWQRVKKGNGTPAPPSAIMIAEQSQLWLTQFHEILTKKGGNFYHLATSLPPHAPATLTLWRTARNIREYPVKVPETGKRSACYHRLRKALLRRDALTAKRGEAVQSMPKQPPAPIHIRIDTQEQRSGIPALLAAMPQVQIEVIPLRMGDYDVGGDPCRVLERKTASDFLSSLAQGRLFAQLTALRKSLFAPILLLEGDPLRVGRSQMRPESIRGALTYITAILRVPILPSLGPADSAHLIYAAAKQCQIGHAARGPAAGRRRASQPEQQMQIVLALPGVGPATARAVCARFGSLHELLNADAAQLATVPGVGPARAAALQQLLHATLPTSEAGS